MAEEALEPVVQDLEILARAALDDVAGAEEQVEGPVEDLEVKVERVNIVKVQSKPKRRGMTRGTRPGWKKAIVQLREGESIEIFEGAQV